jgi:hypothetical protein
VPKGRVLHSSIVAFISSPSPSGVVPGDDAGGRVFKLDFVDGGDGPDCVMHFNFSVVSVKFEGFGVFSCYLEVSP